MRWNKKSQNIKEELANLEDKLQPTEADNKHPQRKIIKLLIKEKIKKAKDEYIKTVEKSVYGKAA